MDLSQSPLVEVHKKYDAKLVEFGGWLMPLSYPLGTIGEHKACRTSCVAFDVSHLGTVRVEGKGSFEKLQSLLTNDLSKISPGKTQYTHLLSPDGSVADDIIVWWIDDEVFDVMPNASNTSRVLSLIGGEDVTRSRAIIAIQGPLARKLTSGFLPEISQIPRNQTSKFKWNGLEVTVAGTGYTGEDGFECAVPLSGAAEFFEALLNVEGLVPAGLGARDTLRLEAGLPLHGHELGEGISPLEAGLSWVVSFDKPTFLGKEALVRQKDQGIVKKLCGFVSSTRKPIRQGQEIMQSSQVVGVVTSGNYSPMLEKGIALGFVSTPIDLNSMFYLEAKGTKTEIMHSKLPFYKGSVR
ncbi:MAG: glycine cleavage system aminomethyltransferase GcvT [Acidimicrobiales bacterium]|nr:glycine cleavage system aminomethyltransferase GcvT [Acidimicrobiales bacterium]